MTVREHRRLWQNRSREFNRRARRIGVEGTVSPTKLREIVYRDQSCCSYCNSHLEYFKRNESRPKSKLAASFDHVVPLAAGGTNTEDNIVCSCQSCNGRRARSFALEPATTGARQTSSEVFRKIPKMMLTRNDRVRLLRGRNAT